MIKLEKCDDDAVDISSVPHYFLERGWETKDFSIFSWTFLNWSESFLN